MIRKLAAVMLLFIVATATVSGVNPSPPITHPPDSAFHEVIIPVPTSKPSIPVIIDPDRRNLETRPPVVVPLAQVVVKEKTSPPKISSKGFHLDSNVSWYGPGFYGNRTACGLAYTKKIMGVAHKTLPCGTKVEFMYKGKHVIVPVIDRGPYVAGRQWDLSGGLCTYLNHCFTGNIYYRILNH